MKGFEENSKMGDVFLCGVWVGAAFNPASAL